MDLDPAQNSREGSTKLRRNGPGSRMILMIVGLRSADACGRDNLRDRYTSLMEVGLGVVHECAYVV